jgi:general secretion pathway protein H
MKRPTSNPNQEGFTLIELMLVLMLMATLFTLTSPLMHKAFPSLKLKAAARDLAQEIRYVQQTAIVSGAESLMRFEMEENRYQSEVVNRGEIRQLPDGIRFTANQQGDQVIVELRFYPDGSSNGGNIQLGNQTQGFIISVDWLTSQVRIIDRQQLRDDTRFEV